MSKAEITVKAVVDDAAVAAMYSGQGVHGVTLPADPGEWTDADLLNAIREGVVTLTILGSRTVVAPVHSEGIGRLVADHVRDDLPGGYDYPRWKDPISGRDRGDRVQDPISGRWHDR